MKNLARDALLAHLEEQKELENADEVDDELNNPQLKIVAEPNYDPNLVDRMKGEEPKSTDNLGTCKCQILRSASQWSIGVSEPETSIFSAYVNLIQEAEKYIYIENQFFISNSGNNKGIVKNR